MFQKQSETTWLQLGLDNRNSNNKIECTRSTNSTANGTIAYSECIRRGGGYRKLSHVFYTSLYGCPWRQVTGRLKPLPPLSSPLWMVVVLSPMWSRLNHKWVGCRRRTSPPWLFDLFIQSARLSLSLSLSVCLSIGDLRHYGFHT